MRYKEISNKPILECDSVADSGATTSTSIATVVQPLGAKITKKGKKGQKPIVISRPPLYK